MSRYVPPSVGCNEKKNYYIKGANFKFKKIKFIIINLKVKNIKMTLPGEGFMTN